MEWMTVMADTKHSFLMYRAPAGKEPRYRGFAEISWGFGVETEAIELFGDRLDNLSVKKCRPQSNLESAAQWATRLSSEVSDDGYSPLGFENFRIDWEEQTARIMFDAELTIDWVFQDKSAEATVLQLYDAFQRSAEILGHVIDDRLGKGPVEGEDVLLYQSQSGQTVFRYSPTISNGHFRGLPLTASGSLNGDDGFEPLLVLAHLQKLIGGNKASDTSAGNSPLSAYINLPNDPDTPGFSLQFDVWDSWSDLALQAGWDEVEMRRKAEALEMFKPRFNTTVIQTSVPSLF